MERLNSATDYDGTLVSISLKDQDITLEEVMAQVRATLLGLGYPESSVNNFIEL